MKTIYLTVEPDDQGPLKVTMVLDTQQLWIIHNALVIASSTTREEDYGVLADDIISFAYPYVPPTEL